MKEVYHYLMASLPDYPRTIYIKVIDSKLEEVTDLLFDHGLVIGQLADWFWEIQAGDGKHPNFDPLGDVYEIDEDMTDIDLGLTEE